MARNPSVEAFRKLLIDTLPPKIRGAAWVALERGSAQMQTTMLSMVPRDEGDLASSIIRTLDAPNLRVTIRAGGAKTTRMVRKGSGVFYDYARAQEFGTVEMRANPFFWPAYRLHKKPMQAAVKSAMKKAFESGSGGLLKL